MLTPTTDDSHVASSRDIHADLVALYKEFDSASFDLRRHTVSATTEPIELEGTYLGPFEIRLDWNELGNGSSHHYQVIALDANPAATNESVTHPHVQDEAVCEGEGRPLIREALKQGRLFDFFVIVANLLRTYNSGSPYVSLAEWHGVACTDCGTTVCDDERWTCEECETTVCGECYFNCPGCDHIYCSECVTRCEDCDESHCGACLKQCSRCHEPFCKGCLQDNERCSNCHDQETTEEPILADAQLLVRNRRQSASAPLRGRNCCSCVTTGDTEVGGFGIAATDDLLLIEDIQLVGQTCSWAHVAFDDVAVADFFDQQVDAGRRPECLPGLGFTRILGTVHDQA